MTDPQDIFAAILRERDFQDMKYGKLLDRSHAIPSWLLIMKKELIEAEDAWCKYGNSEAMKELLQAVTVGVACLQQYGITERSKLEIDAVRMKMEV